MKYDHEADERSLIDGRSLSRSVLVENGLSLFAKLDMSEAAFYGLALVYKGPVVPTFPFSQRHRLIASHLRIDLLFPPGLLLPIIVVPVSVLFVEL